MPDQNALTLTEAADACGVHRSTIRRHLDGDDFPNAYREDGRQGPETGPWRIPIGDLLGVGLEPNRQHEAKTLEQEEQQRAATVDQTGRVRELEARTVELERQLAVERARREAAEQLAEERRERVEDLRVAVTAIEQVSIETARRELTTPEPRRGWWRKE